MERRRPSIVGPLILITAGVLFLMANLGLLPLSFWQIAASFWPLLLILIGLDIIVGRHSLVGALVVVLLWVTLVGGGIWLATTQGSAFLPAATTATDQLSQPLGDIKSASVNLDIGVANTSMAALGSDSTDLFQGTFRHAQGTRVVQTYNVVGSEGRLALKEEGATWMFWGPAENRWDLRLNPQVPLALNIHGGVGRATLDFSALTVSSLMLNSGVGTVDITTPKSGVTTVSVDGGVGSTSVVIPAGVAARIRVSGGLGSIRVDESRFPRFGTVYQSADYASASNKIDMEVDGGVGSINIR